MVAIAAKRLASEEFSRAIYPFKLVLKLPTNLWQQSLIFVLRRNAISVVHGKSVFQRASQAIRMALVCAAGPLGGDCGGTQPF